jgi:hypothetical protein
LLLAPRANQPHLDCWIEALNRHRGKGQQKVTVEHVHVHAGGEAVVGMVESPGGRGSSEITGTTPCEANCPCTTARDAEPGQGAGAGAGRQRCRTAVADCMAGCPQAPQRVTRMPSSTDTVTAEAIARRREIANMLREARAIVKEVN